jgi:hypothetical protein
LRQPQSRLRDTAQISRGKIDRLRRTPVGSTTRPLMAVDFAIGCSLVRPGRPRYPLLVYRAATLLHASFRPRLATTPLRFANPSPPSGWIKDFHLQAVDHARHTANGSRECAPDDRLREIRDSRDPGPGLRGACHRAALRAEPLAPSGLQPLTTRPAQVICPSGGWLTGLSSLFFRIFRKILVPSDPNQS